MHVAQCRKCLATATITESSTDVHEAVDKQGCKCCPQPHHHGDAANATGKPCRPVQVTLTAGSVSAALGA